MKSTFLSAISFSKRIWRRRVKATGRESDDDADVIAASFALQHVVGDERNLEGSDGAPRVVFREYCCTLV